MMDAYPVQLPSLLRTVADEHPYPLLFATVSGAHLYGFPSADSDFDLRGVHVLPRRELLGLDIGPETIERTGDRDGFEIDLVTHDVGKFIRLLLRPNGYVLEQLLSPLVVKTTPIHEKLREIAPQCITRFHAHHYLGFADTQWKLFQKESPRRVKPLLYVFRVLLTGIHLMRSGAVEANLVRLNEIFRLPYVPELIARKRSGAEQEVLAASESAWYLEEFVRLVGDLELARDATFLPPEPTGRAALHALLISVREANNL